MSTCAHRFSLFLSGANGRIQARRPQPPRPREARSIRSHSITPSMWSSSIINRPPPVIETLRIPALEPDSTSSTRKVTRSPGQRQDLQRSVCSQSLPTGLAYRRHPPWMAGSLRVTLSFQRVRISSISLGCHRRSRWLRFDALVDSAMGAPSRPWTVRPSQSNAVMCEPASTCRAGTNLSPTDLSHRRRICPRQSPRRNLHVPYSRWFLQ